MNRRGFLKSILAAGMAPYVVTTAGVLMPVRQLAVPLIDHVWSFNMAGLTSNCTVTLPAGARVGSCVGVHLKSGGAHDLLITAASGDTLNGVVGGEEWSRLFIADERVIMRCVEEKKWVVEHDGRISLAAT